MSNVNISAILDMAKLALQVGAQVKDVVDTFQRHGIDETVYAAVIADHRTFRDFHGPNPQQTPPVVPFPIDPPPEPQPVPTGTVEYYRILDFIPPDADLADGDSVYLDGNGKAFITGKIGGHIPDGFTFSHRVAKG